jgi:hypothetical protein
VEYKNSRRNRISVQVEFEPIALLAKSDGARWRRLTLARGKDGALVMTAHDMGGAPEAAWSDDREVTLEVPQEALAQLAVALAAELFRGRTDAVAQLASICDAHDIEHRVALWS